MAKNWVVSISPVSPYQAGSPQSAGRGEKEPRGCLSKPTARPRSNSPDLIVLQAPNMAEPPVAHPLATLMKGMPVSPNSDTMVSAFPAASDPPNAN